MQSYIHVNLSMKDLVKHIDSDYYLFSGLLVRYTGEDAVQDAGCAVSGTVRSPRQFLSPSTSTVHAGEFINLYVSARVI